MGLGRRSAGFTLVELLVVIAVIAVIAAVAMPSFIAMVRNADISGAARNVAGELQTARAKAIARNTNNGVVFVIVSPNTYRYVMEDLPGQATRLPLSTLATTHEATQAGPLRTLPGRVTFGTGCPGFAPDGTAIRFRRLGNRCQVGGSTDCPSVDVAGAYLQNGASDSVICLEEAATGLRRTVRIGSGGRVVIQ